MHGQSANKVCKVNSCLVAHQGGHKVSSEDASPVHYRGTQSKVNEWTCGEFANGETQLFPMEKKPVQWLVRQEGGTRDHAEGNARPARLEGDT